MCIKVRRVSALLLCALLSCCAGTLFCLSVCLSLFLRSHFLTFGKPKCFHTSLLKLTGASTKLCQPVLPHLWRRPTLLLNYCEREKQSERRQKKKSLMPGKATKLFGSQNELKNRLSHLHWVIYVVVYFVLDCVCVDCIWLVPKRGGVWVGGFGVKVHAAHTVLVFSHC